MTVTSRSASARIRFGAGRALGAKLGRLTLPLRVHAVGNVLGILLRQIGALDAHVDHLQPNSLALLVICVGDLLHQGFALVAHDVLEGCRAEHPPQRRIGDGAEARTHVALITNGLVEQQGSAMRSARRRRPRGAFCPMPHLLRCGIEIQDALVEIIDGLRRTAIFNSKPGSLMMRHRLAEFEHDRLLVHMHDEERRSRRRLRRRRGAQRGWQQGLSALRGTYSFSLRFAADRAAEMARRPARPCCR